MNNQATVCKICSEKLSRYKCPKCCLNYCSVECYKSEAHMQCSENFYKQCFMEGLKERSINQESKLKFCNMLSKLENQFNLEDDELLQEDFKDPSFVNSLDEKSKTLWDKLSSDEKKIFCEMDTRGDFTSLINVWNPWWIQDSSYLIEDENKMSDMLKKIPTLRTPPDFEKLIGNRKPSDKLCYNILNVMYGYAYMMRLHNGDYTDLLLDIAQGLMCISSAFGDAVYPDVCLALDHCIMSLNAEQPAGEFFVSKEYSMAIIQDVSSIIKGPNCFRSTVFIEAALSHCLTIFQKASRRLNRSEEVEKCRKFVSFSNVDMKKLFLKVVKKLEFFHSWVKKYGAYMTSLECVVQQELHQHLSSLSQMKTDEDFVKEVLSQSRYSLVSGSKIEEL